MLRRRDRRGTGADEHDAGLRDVAAGHLERVEQRGAGDDGGAVLVIVEDRDGERLPQPLLDVEAVRRADVLQVDPADRRLQHLAEADDVLGLRGVDLEVEHVEVGERLEEDALALHHGLPGERTNVAKAEHRGPVGDDGDEIALRRVPVGVLGAITDREARLGDAGGVGEREIALVLGGLGGDDLDLAGPALLVVGEGLRPAIGGEGRSQDQSSA